MLIDSNTLSASQNIESTFCIIGGGAAGIVLARELADAGVTVCLLESGGENYTPESQELYSPAEDPKDYPSPSYSRLRYLGGATNHWANNTSPLSPIDFEERSWVPDSGWPIKYLDLEPFYEQAAVYCGTKDDGYDLVYWLNKLSAVDVLKGSSILQTGVAKASFPPVRFYERHGQKLKEADNVSLYVYANFTDLTFDEENQRVSEVSFRSNEKPEIEHWVRAEYFIFCMGGLENARMLLHVNNKYAQQLGNQGGCVGRYFMDHPLPRAAIFYANKPEIYEFYRGYDFPDRRVLGFFELTPEQQLSQQANNLRLPLTPQTNYLLSDGISSYHILVEALSNGELPNELGSHLLNVISDLDMVGEAIARKLLDKKIFDRADEVGGFEIPMMMEQTPHPDNRVLLSDNARDRYGIPKLLIEWTVRQDDKAQLWKALEITGAGVGELNLGRIRLLRERDDRLWGDQLGFGHHHMGTTRMSSSVENGVVDKHQKVFGTENLFISGSSVFSTGGHVPPTLTIVALTLRLAEFLKTNVLGANNNE